MVGLCFCLGIATALPATEIIEAAVTAIFVCYVKSPSALKIHQNQLHEDIRTTLDYEGLRLQGSKQQGQESEASDSDSYYSGYSSDDELPASGRVGQRTGH